MSSNLDDGEQFRAVHTLILELSDCTTLDDLFYRSVALGRKRIGIDRMSILLYESRTDEMVGTWGTDIAGNLINESDFRKKIGSEMQLFAETIQNHDYVAVWDNRTLNDWGKPVGNGWNAMVSLWYGPEPFGWIAADNLIHHEPLSPMQREMLARLARTISSQIQKIRYSEKVNNAVDLKTAELIHSQSKLEELNNSLSAQNQLKERLFTILAHDLRGPIGAMRSLFTMVCEFPERFSDQELRALMPQLQMSSDSAYNLLENILGWVRGQMSDTNAPFVAIPSQRIISTVIDWLEPHAKSKQIQLIPDYGPNLHYFSDEHMIEVIARNLVSNAIKFSPPSSSITIKAVTCPENRSTCLQVIDRGLGMNQAQIDQLFTMRNSLRTKGTAGEQGSGLGLMFSFDLAKRLGGTIMVESNPGLGSTFSLVLPDTIEGDSPAI